MKLGILAGSEAVAVAFLLACLLGETCAAAEYAWKARSGGGSDDTATAVAVGPNGVRYVTGVFQGTAGFGTTNLVSRGDVDIFIAAYSSAGQLLWAVQAGGTSGESSRGCAADANGNVYITGYFRNSATFGTFTITGSNNGDMFVAKYDSSGQCVWVHRAGSGYAAVGDACAVDQNGDIYVVGHYFWPTTFWDGYSLGNAGEYDVFLAKISPTGHILLLNSLGGPSYSDFASGVAVDTSLNCFVSGVLSGYSFVAKYNSVGIQQWVNQTGAYGPGATWTVVPDNSGGVFFAGRLNGATILGGLTVTNAGGADGVLGHLNTSGQPLWVRTYGGTNDDEFRSITRDNDGNLLVTGFFQDSANIGGTVFTSAGGKDILTAKFGSNGTPIWVAQSGGSGDDVGESLSLGEGGAWVIAGSFSATATFGNSSLTSAGGTDAFVAEPLQNLEILNQPQSRSIQAGLNVTFTVTAAGTPPFNYQWRKNGVNIPGATSSSLTLNSVGAANSGGYSVVVWNAYGSVASATAYLAVLTDGANGNQPTQIPALPGPVQPVGVDSLVIVTHGWEPLGPFADISWITEMANAIQAVAPNWKVVPFDWMGAAWLPDPDLTLVTGAAVGSLYAKLRLVPQHWQRIHLIAHSAGSAVIEAMAKELKASPSPPVIHETFLDPYTGMFLTGRSVYGSNAAWADNYFVFNFGTDIAPVAAGWSPGSTAGPLDYAYNVDIGAAIQSAAPFPVYFSSGIAGSTPAVAAGNISLTHGSPYEFYLSTVDDTAPPCATGYGFAFSQEGGGWSGHDSRHRGDPPFPLCGSVSPVQNSQPVNISFFLSFQNVPNATSPLGVNLFSGGGANLSASPTPPASRSSGPPTWLALALTITNAVNFVQFDAGFMDTNSAEGLLTVYWNTNQIGLIDERVVSPGLHTYRFGLPRTVADGLYTLSFRLDTFTNSTSSLTLTNIATGFMGVPQPITLGIALGTNSRPILQLTAAPGYNYLLQSSTNLTDWTATALLVNTNGTMFFTDTSVTNSTRRFYRAVMP